MTRHVLIAAIALWKYPTSTLERKYCCRMLGTLLACIEEVDEVLQYVLLWGLVRVARCIVLVDASSAPPPPRANELWIRECWRLRERHEGVQVRFRVDESDNNRMNDWREVS